MARGVQLPHMGWFSKLFRTVARRAQPTILDAGSVSTSAEAGPVNGIVKWFNDDKGYGFIKSPSGEDVFVHHSSIQSSGYRTLKGGEPVEFIIKQGPQGLQAEAVRRVTLEEEPSSVSPSQEETLAVTFVDGAIRLVSVTPEGTFQYLDPSRHLHGILYIAGRETIAFQDAIEEFEEILNRPSAAEKELQDFFERHPDFILRDEHKAAVPHVVLEREAPSGPLIPDFVLEPLQPDGLADLLELKKPNAKLFVLKSNRIRYSAALLEACAQLREYSEFFESKQNRKLIHEKFGLLAYRPRLFVVIGRRGTVDPIISRRVAADIALPVVIDTYDDILARVNHRLQKMRHGGYSAG